MMNRFQPDTLTTVTGVVCCVGFARANGHVVSPIHLLVATGASAGVFSGVVALLRRPTKVRPAQP